MILKLFVNRKIKFINIVKHRVCRIEYNEKYIYTVSINIHNARDAKRGAMNRTQFILKLIYFEIKKRRLTKTISHRAAANSKPPQSRLSISQDAAAAARCLYTRRLDPKQALRAYGSRLRSWPRFCSRQITNSFTATAMSVSLSLSLDAAAIHSHYRHGLAAAKRMYARTMSVCVVAETGRSIQLMRKVAPISVVFVSSKLGI